MFLFYFVFYFCLDFILFQFPYLLLLLKQVIFSREGSIKSYLILSYLIVSQPFLSYVTLNSNTARKYMV